MRLTGIALIVILTLAGAWTGSLPKELTHAIQQRKRFYHNRSIVFRVHTDEKVLQPHPRQSQSHFILTISCKPHVVQVIQQPLNASTARTAQGNRVRFHIDSGGAINYSSTCYLSNDTFAIIEPDLVFSTGNQPVMQQAQMFAIIERGNLDRLYSHPPMPGLLCQQVSGLLGVFTIGLDVTRLYEACWERVETRPDRWILHGRAKANRYDPSLPEDYPDVLLQVELRKPDALPLKLELVSPFRNGQWYRETLRAVGFRKEGDLWVPSTFTWHHDGSQKTFFYSSSYELVRFARLNQEVTLQLPLGTQVEDRRLGSSVNYRWQGHLPTEEELRRLAYRQGYLLPPAAPRRRYSLWLFAPAVLFFTAAAYLYWRQRRHNAA
jgi:hypothetical protein